MANYVSDLIPTAPQRPTIVGRAIEHGRTVNRDDPIDRNDKFVYGHEKLPTIGKYGTVLGDILWLMPKTAGEKIAQRKKRQCGSKARYPGPVEAAKALLGWVSKRPSIEGHPFSVYYCLFCSGWHIGHTRVYNFDPPTEDPRLKGQMILFDFEGTRIVYPNCRARKKRGNKR